MKESDLGPPVIAWLQDRGWDVYQEVSYRGACADIVAVAGRLTWIVELKTSFSFALIDQLISWQGVAHYRSAATPSVQTRKGGHSQSMLLRYTGIGHLSVSLDGATSVYETRRPKLDRRLKRAYGISLKESCQPQHQSGLYGVAGCVNAEGGRWTPWRRTCEAVRDYVTSHEGCSMGEMVKGITHHYPSDKAAQSALAGWLSVGKIPHVRFVTRGPHHPRGGRHRKVLILAGTSVESR